jgi:hypothetical protein
VVVSPQRISESARNRGIVSLLPERHDDELVSLVSTHVEEIPTREIAHEQSPVGRSLDLTGFICSRHGSLDVRLFTERSADALAIALGGVIGDSDQHRQQATIVAWTGDANALLDL